MDFSKKAPIVTVVVALSLALVLIINAIIYDHEKKKGGISSTNAEIMIVVNAIALIPAVGIAILAMLKIVSSPK
mgnify:CR=1 FL=1